MIEIRNHGPLLLASNYWDDEMSARGLCFLSLNAGAFRLLLPPAGEPWLADMKSAAQRAVADLSAWRPLK